MIGIPTLLSIIAIVIIIIQWNRVLTKSKRVSIGTGTTTNAYRTNNMVPPHTSTESALSASLHSVNASEWSVVSNSDNDIYVNAQY